MAFLIIIQKSTIYCRKRWGTGQGRVSCEATRLSALITEQLRLQLSNRQRQGARLQGLSKQSIKGIQVVYVDQSNLIQFNSIQVNLACT